MSIDVEIKARVGDGSLVEFQPSPGIGPYRPVFLLPEINARIISPWSDIEEDSDMQFVQAALDNFVGGFSVTATFKKTPKTQLRRLSVKQRKQPKVWEVRINDPKPPYRLIGLFADQDTFVGTELTTREDIDFEFEIKRANSIWNRLFSSHEPVVSENINEYIADNVVYLS